MSTLCPVCKLLNHMPSQDEWNSQNWISTVAVLDIAWLGKAAVPGLRIGRRRRHLQASHTNYHWDASFRAMVPWYHGKTWWMPQKTRLLCAVQDQVACGGSRSATGYSVSGRICCSISLQPSSKLRPVVRHLVASSLAKLVYNSNNLGLWLIYLYIFYRFPIWFINIYKLAYNWGCTTFLGGDAGVDVFLEPPCRNWTTAWVVADRLEELDELTYLKPSCILKDSWLRIGRTWCLWNSWQLYYWIARW